MYWPTQYFKVPFLSTKSLAKWWGFFFPPLFLTLQLYTSFPGLTRKLIVSQVWDPEVQNQGVSRFVPSDGWQERLCSGHLSLACRQLSSLCACLCPSFPSSQGHWSCWTRTHTNDLISIRWALQYTTMVAQVVKNRLANAGDKRDSGSIPGSGRSPGGGNGNPLQHSCLENPMDRGAWWATVHGVAKSWTWLSDLAWMHAKPPPPPSPNKVTCWGTGWLGLEHRNLGGEYSSPHSQHRLLSPILEMCLVVCSLMGRQWRRDCDRATLWWQGCQGPPLRLSSATAPNGCPYDPLSSLRKPFNYIQ